MKGQAAQVREDEAFDEEVREHIALLEKRYQAAGHERGGSSPGSTAPVRERDIS